MSLTCHKSGPNIIMQWQIEGGKTNPLQQQQKCCTPSSKVVNESSFVENWMFDLNSKTKVKYSRSPQVRTKPTNNVLTWGCKKSKSLRSA